MTKSTVLKPWQVNQDVITYVPAEIAARKKASYYATLQTDDAQGFYRALGFEILEKETQHPFLMKVKLPEGWGIEPSGKSQANSNIFDEEGRSRLTFYTSGEDKKQSITNAAQPVRRLRIKYPSTGRHKGEQGTFYEAGKPIVSFDTHLGSKTPALTADQQWVSNEAALYGADWLLQYIFPDALGGKPFAYWDMEYEELSESIEFFKKIAPDFLKDLMNTTAQKVDQSRPQDVRPRAEYDKALIKSCIQTLFKQYDLAQAPRLEAKMPKPKLRPTALTMTFSQSYEDNSQHIKKLAAQREEKKPAEPSQEELLALVQKVRSFFADNTNMVLIQPTYADDLIAIKSAKLLHDITMCPEVYDLHGFNEIYTGVLSEDTLTELFKTVITDSSRHANILEYPFMVANLSKSDFETPIILTSSKAFLGSLQEMGVEFS